MSHIATKLLVDAMLGKLGRFARILGFDTVIADAKQEDSTIQQQLINENRILVSSDKAFIVSMKHKRRKTVFIDQTYIGDQLVQLLTTLESMGIVIDLSCFVSRCVACNSLLKETNSVNLTNSLPPNVLNNFDRFWVCTNNKCKKIYWKGSHWLNISQIINYTKTRMVK